GRGGDGSAEGSPPRPGRRLDLIVNRRGTALAGPDAYGVLDRHDHQCSIVDVARAGRLHDDVRRRHCLVVADDDLDLDPRMEIDGGRGGAGVPHPGRVTTVDRPPKDLEAPHTMWDRRRPP